MNEFSTFNTMPNHTACKTNIFLFQILTVVKKFKIPAVCKHEKDLSYKMTTTDKVYKVYKILYLFLLFQDMHHII